MAKFENVCRWLQDKIADHTFAVNEKIPSENELAAQFGYSRQTIRQAIGILQNEGILKRVQGSGTYVTGSATLPKHAATMRIGVITASPDDLIFPGIIDGINEILSGQGYTISLGVTHNRQTDEENALHRMLENGVDGLIIECTKSAFPNVNEILYRTIRDCKIPIVFFNGYYRNFRESYVIIDEIRAGELAALALIEKGHKKIGGIFKSDDMRGINRYKGMQKVIREQGLCPEDKRFVWCTTEDLTCLFSGNFDSMLLSRFFGTTALVSHNDDIAASLIRLLRQHKICVPEDVSVISFDNSLLAGTMSCSLTSVFYPPVQIGRLAAELILKKLSDPSCMEYIILEPKIEYRSSISDLGRGSKKA